jgi:hypothetical protein
LGARPNGNPNPGRRRTFLMTDTLQRKPSGLKFGATSIFVDNIPSTLDFYRRAFGLETRFYDPDNEW